MKSKIKNSFFAVLIAFTFMLCFLPSINKVNAEDSVPDSSSEVVESYENVTYGNASEDGYYYCPYGSVNYYGNEMFVTDSERSAVLSTSSFRAVDFCSYRFGVLFGECVGECGLIIGNLSDSEVYFTDTVQYFYVFLTSDGEIILSFNNFGNFIVLDVEVIPFFNAEYPYYVDVVYRLYNGEMSLSAVVRSDNVSSDDNVLTSVSSPTLNSSGTYNFEQEYNVTLNSFKNFGILTSCENAGVKYVLYTVYDYPEFYRTLDGTRTAINSDFDFNIVNYSSQLLYDSLHTSDSLSTSSSTQNKNNYLQTYLTVIFCVSILIFIFVVWHKLKK